MNSKIKKLTNRHERIISNLDPHSQTKLQTNQKRIQSLTEKINEIGKHRYNKIKAHTKANKHLLTESVNKYWCRWGNETKPRDTITELERNSDPPSYTSDPNEMTEISCNTLQLHPTEGP
jgi:ABC-type Zn uptake system ZnuABC Zn-binding protein ZnuA